MNDAAIGFWENRELWLEAVVTACAVAGVAAYLGIFVVLRRAVFVTATLTQAASVGVVFGFMATSLLGYGERVPLWLDPSVLAVAFAIGTAILFSMPRRERRIPTEAVIAYAYLFGSAAVVLLGTQIVREAKDVADVLFGSAVAVEPRQMWITIASVGVAGAVVATLQKDIVFASFDRQAAIVAGYPVRRLDVVLFAAIAVVTATATRALGALPVFGFLVLPSMASLLAVRRLSHALLAAALLGPVAAFLGYFVSWKLDLPVGASMTGLCVLFVAAAALVARLRRA